MMTALLKRLLSWLRGARADSTVDVRQRRRALRQRPDDFLTGPAPTDALLLRLPQTEWCFDPANWAAPPFGLLLRLRPPESAPSVVSVTWQIHQRVIPPDALLIITDVGYLGLADQRTGVLSIRAELLPTPVQVVHVDKRKAEKVTIYNCSVRWSPYPENVAHSDIVIYEHGKAPSTQEDVDRLKSLPNGIKKQFIGLLSDRLIQDFASTQKPPVAVYPDGWPTFVNASATPIN